MTLSVCGDAGRQVRSRFRGTLCAARRVQIDRMKKILKIWRRLGVSSDLSARLFRFAVYALLLFLAFEFVTVDFDWPEQVVLGALTIVVAYALHLASGSETVTLALMLASMLATARYAYWRCLSVYRALVDPAGHLVWIDFVFILILLTAEIYAWIILYLGYVQSTRPLRRAPVPLPRNVEQWPHVDVLIPTYNEPLSVVRSTAFAAQNIDYPPDKLHVYILDDGRRENFEQFCAEAGIGYRRRSDNQHAKAGNINEALRSVDSPYVAIFDCDHVPTRSFLQVTLGWLLANQRVGMLQTPHFYYSPDPFERNLDHFKEIPNEGELFYGVLQDGNDLWNATFFCGSCAVLRRSALDQIGGVATETVTEDAHTSLRMQMRGWETAYINIPQAAGLATESLSSHIGQRIRWARGMTQILRTDCPLFADGLKWPQRLCYFNSMIHYLYAGPRLVFLTAPLVYMLFGHTCIPGFWGAILAYAIPHLFLATVTNVRIQGRHRFSFWNEVYETILAPYILAPTLLALVSPKLGKFKVTAKGGIVKETHFDHDIALPYIVLILLNLIALASIPIHVLYGVAAEPSTVILNAFWILFNTVLLGTATGVAMESKQLRKDVRLDMCLPAEIHLPGLAPAFGESVDMSLGGASLRLEKPLDLRPGEELEVLYPLRDHQAGFKATVIGRDEETVRIRYHELSLEEEEMLTLVLFSSADTWLNRMEGRESDRPLRSFGQLVRLSIRGVGFALRSLARRKKRSQVVEAATVTATLILALLALGLPARMQAAVTGSEELSSSSTAGSGSFDHELSFKELVPGGEIAFYDPQSARSVSLDLPSSEVVQQSKLHLRYIFSTAMIARRSFLRVLFNGTLVAALPVPEGEGAGQPITTDLTLPADLFLRNNRLEFQLEGDDPAPCEHAEGVPWARIDASSTVETAGVLLPLADDLERLPWPFYDSGVSGAAAAIPFVFLEQPDRQMLAAAGVVASWFGVRAGSQRLELPVAIGRDLPQGNLILFADHPWLLPPEMNLKVNGPVVAERTNPNDPYGKVLIVAGTDDAQLLAAAQWLTVGGSAGGAGAASSLGHVLPPGRSADDAPLWLRTRRAQPLWRSPGPVEMQAHGSAPIAIDLRLPPDLYYGGHTFLRLHADYSYNPSQTTDGSLLRIEVNGARVEDLSLTPGEETSRRVSRVVPIPVADLRPYANRLEFSFLPRLAKPVGCALPRTIDLNGAIRGSSSLSLWQLHHWAILPDLKLFSAAGFPFTRYADLAQTVVVLPQYASTGEIGVYLMLLAFFGSQTGYPALRVRVGALGSQGGASDYLVIGTVQDSSLLSGEHLWGHLAERRSAWRRVLAALLGETGDAGASSNVTAANLTRPPQAVIQEVRSPWAKDRTIVSLVLRDGHGAPALESAFPDAAGGGGLAESVSVLRSGRFDSYSVGERTYTVGHMEWWEIVRFRLRQFPWLIVLLNFVLGLFLVPWMQARLDQRQRMRLEVGNP